MKLWNFLNGCFAQRERLNNFIYQEFKDYFLRALQPLSNAECSPFAMKVSASESRGSGFGLLRRNHNAALSHLRLRNEASC
jgi:hypothetical protein